MRGRSNVTPERLEQARQLVEDGASQMEIRRSTGLARETIVKYFPDCRWTFQEAGTHGAFVRHLERRVLS